MNIKIVFIDLDGTLLDNNKAISAENIEAIQKAKQAGVIVVISTGRSQELSQFAIDAVKPDYFAGMNSAVLVDLRNNETIFKLVLDRDTTKATIHLLERLGMSYQVHSHSGTYSPTPHMTGAHPNVKPMVDISTIEPTKFFARADTAAQAAQFLKELKAIDGIKAVLVMENGFDVLSAEQDKAVSAKILCDKLQIKPEEAAAIGDSANDLELLQFVGCSIAMGNATAELKTLCKHTAPTNDDNGVAWAMCNVVGVKG